MRIVSILFLVLASILGTGSGLVASADDAAKERSLAQSLAAFFAAKDGDERMLVGLDILLRFEDPAQVADAIPSARTWPADAAKDDIISWKRASADGVEHTILANIPASYDASKAMPVLIWLHGGVSRDQDGGAASGIRLLKEYSDSDGFLLLSPSAQTGSEWWTPNGVALVRGALADLAERYHLDGNRVAVAGFSDGASGCFHLLAHDPEPYACFLPLMAHPGVTRLAGGPCFAANVRSRPVFAMNGGQDTLYPSVRIKPMIDELREAGCDIEWTDLPEAGHRLSDVFPDQWDRLRAFWKSHPRKALPRQIAWESAVPALDGRFGWVEVVEVDAQAPSDPALKAAVLKDPAGRKILGIRMDTKFAGPGVKIESVSEGSAAAEAGFQAGDVIVQVDDESLRSEQAFVALRRALGRLNERDGVFHVQRGEGELQFTCRPRVSSSSASARPEGLGYGQASGRVVARVEKGNVIHVQTRHVAEFRLHLAPGLVDLSKPVTVFVNGKQRSAERAAGSVRYVLEAARRAGPGAPLWQGTIRIRP